MKTLTATVLTTVISCCLLAQEIPLKISYQGKLYENGSPVNGTKSIKFTIGMWEETHPSVIVTDGLYSVTLGEYDSIPISTFDNSATAILQITVDGNLLSPQTDILSVPYAYKAEKAVYAEKPWIQNGNNIYYNSGNVGIGSINPRAMLEIVRSGTGDHPLVVRMYVVRPSWTKPGIL